MVESKGDWTQILLVYGLSILSACVISEAAPVLGAIAADIHSSSPAEVGLVMSIPALVVVFSALLIGGLVDAIGDKPVLIVGATILVVGDLGVLFSGTMPVLLGWRLVEGVGYGCMSIASITMMTRITEGARRTAALALWSTVIPVSFLAAAALAFFIAGAGQWRPMFITHAGLTSLLLAIGVVALPGRGQFATAGHHLSGVVGVLRSPWPYILGVSFAAIAFLQTGMIAALAALLGAKVGATEAQVQPFTIITMVFNIIGAFSVGPLLNYGWRTWVLAVGSTVICIGAGYGLFFGSLTLISALALDCVLLLGCGFLVGLWALLPLAAPTPRTIGATSGLVTQITLLGVLFGPPGAFVALAHGTFGATLFLGISAVGILIGFPVWLRRPQLASSNQS